MNCLMIRTGTLALSAMLLTGCGNPQTEKSPETSDPTKTQAEADAHAHPSEGPHHGSLIELGQETYHAELVHDEKAGTVTIYLLDGPTAKTAVATDAPEVTINVKHDGKPEQFQLAAKPEAGDPEGKSSRFVSNDAELMKDLDEEHTEASLMVKIEGKPYNGQISHSHDHAAHAD